MLGGRLWPRPDGEAVSLAALKDSKRTLLIGMGGGGDAVGALAVTELLADLGTEWVLGGVAWERSPIDPRPVTVRVKDEHHGCRSWVEIDRELPFEGTPVMADEEFERAAAAIREICQGELVPA